MYRSRPPSRPYVKFSGRVSTLPLLKFRIRILWQTITQRRTIKITADKYGIRTPHFPTPITVSYKQLYLLLNNINNSVKKKIKYTGTFLSDGKILFWVSKYCHREKLHTHTHTHKVPLNFLHFLNIRNKLLLPEPE